MVATARKLATIAWQLLVTNEPYRYALPRATEYKLARLRVAATGQRRRTGPRKGTQKPAAYGTGTRTRAIPALDRVYAQEGLPSLTPPPPGEVRMLEQTQTAGFANGVRQEQRIARRSGSRRRDIPDHAKEIANTEELTRS